MKTFPSDDAPTFEALYNTYSEPVYRLALRMLGNTNDAEDLTQEVFIDFWQKQQYDPSRGRLITFLLVMTRSRALNYINKRKSRKRLLQRWETAVPVNETDHVLHHVILSEASVQLTAALKTLPAPQRQVLTIAYYEGLSQSEIKTRLGIPLGTVKTRSRQGLRKLRRKIFNQEPQHNIYEYACLNTRRDYVKRNG
ncbi:sigma-70 family RNA polymerase sigma factor [filamentous cyanobacterium LEGE 11480]|uniref:Sigma-70 family RNA polymerase sigma factor n=1 Tax=Romeriopsis navalis LEGE 11480 TaxID=2777977 RepID=A0A928Z279_9CYAN|nr:sigma-70 family RNA polymerase sigma factor [Romeriopsis navalis]MBE9030121.1 sigma-70 family RNA polymerase sigma factor [Romeriopsis navalis LEGE 11480]